MTKPFQVEEVLARVKAHVALRRARAELADSLTRLRTLEHLRDEMVRMVIHDMRSPLASLLMDLRFLAGSAKALSEDGQAALQSALKAVREMTAMASDVLDVSRLEAGSMPIERAVWDLTRMAREVCSALADAGIERAVDVESAGAAEVTCDGALVRRVMENFVSNGIRYSPASTRVRISIASGKGPCESRARPGGRRGSGRQGEDLREVRLARGASGIELPLRRAESPLLQARHRGAWRDHRRGFRRAGGLRLLVRAARVISQRFDRLRRHTGA